MTPVTDVTRRARRAARGAPEDGDGRAAEGRAGSAGDGDPGVETGTDGRSAALGAFIRDQRRVARLSLRKLSELAHVSNPYLSQIERGLRRPSAEILQQLAKALRISAESLYVRAGILDEKPERRDLTQAIWEDSTLTETQKRALVQVYRSFQAENG